MREKNKYFKNINFSPFKLKESKADNFSIPNNHVSNRNKSTVSSTNKNNNQYSVIKRNPTENFLYDKININNLSQTKSILNLSVPNETNIPNSINNIKFQNNNKHYNSQSVDCAQKKYFKKQKYNDNYINSLLYTQNYNYKYYRDKYKYKNIVPIKYPTKFNNINKNKNIFFRNQFYDRIKDNIRNNNIQSITVFFENKKNKKYAYRNIKNTNEYGKNNLKSAKKYSLLKKIILIQSFWRSYFLRKLVVGGLEKYYSSIALNKYFNNILYKNKQILFQNFIESMKEYINKKHTYLGYKKNKNNIKKNFKNHKDSTSRFGIPRDKKKDNIYLINKKDQNKNINTKNKNNIYKNINKGNQININKNYRNNKAKFSSLHQKNDKNYFINENRNIKVNLINNKRIPNNFSQDNLKYIHKKYNNNNINLILEKNKKNLKNIYIKKKVGEENSIILSNEIASLILNERKDKSTLLNSLVKTIKKKFLKLFYPLLIKALNSEKTKNISTYYEILKNKPEEENESHKIKVNKNSKIEKNRKLKLLKKIVEKKSIQNNKNNAIFLTKYFIFWKGTCKKLLSVHFRSSGNLKKSKTEKPKSFNKKKKKHIKVKLKKSFTSYDTLFSNNSTERKILSSLTLKKMKMIKQLSDENYYFSTVISDNDKSRKYLITPINTKDNIFFNKILSLIKKLEIKNNKHKYFYYWKKESKNKEDN